MGVLPHMGILPRPTLLKISLNCLEILKNKKECLYIGPIYYLTRFAIQAKGPDGKWTRKPLAYRESNNVHLLITRPPEICVNLIFKHIHAASSYTSVDNLFHSFIVLCENECFLMSNLH